MSSRSNQYHEVLDKPQELLKKEAPSSWRGEGRGPEATDPPCTETAFYTLLSCIEVSLTYIVPDEADREGSGSHTIDHV